MTRRAITADSLTCVLCHRSFNNLGLHVALAHHLSMDQYRQSAGLPPKTPLVIPELRTRQLRTLANLRDSGLNHRRSAPTNDQKQIGQFDIVNVLAALDLVIEEATSLRRFLLAIPKRGPQ